MIVESFNLFSVTPDALLGGLVKWAPLLTLLFSSVVTGLTNESKEPGAARWAKAALNFFSFLTHKDVPGTFQLPLGMARPKKVVEAESPPQEGGEPKKPQGAVPTAIGLLVVGLLNFAAGCAGWTKADTAAALRGVLDCTVGPLLQSTTAVLPLVEGALKGENWKKELEGLGFAYGANAITCATKHVAAGLGLPTTAAPSPAALKAKANAETYFKVNKIPLANVKVAPIPR